jgi:PRC-barrel domain
MMTAANLGPRVTDCGFAIFLLASICWTAIGLPSGQSSLIYANRFLILVNAVGVWRWLGRQAAYEDGPTHAAERSAHEKVPSLFSFSALTSAEIVDQKGKKFGTIVDVMGSVSSHEIAYFVVNEGGIGGLGSGPIKYAFEALKWQRYRRKMPAADSHSTGKGILLRDRSQFNVRRI